MDCLARIQRAIEQLYDVEAAADVRDYLVTERRLLPESARDAAVAEQDEVLLVAEEPGGIALSLYLAPQVLQALDRQDPDRRLDATNVAAFWTALEGVSHFVCLLHHLRSGRGASLLELELQAEVDKYALSIDLLARQHPHRWPRELHHLLFRRTRIDPVLAGARRELYATASDYAGRFCRHIEQAFEPRRRSRPRSAELHAQLRRFYRQPALAKLRLIDALP
jgi:hypothetical protein